MSQTIALPWPTPPLTQNQVRRMHFQIEARMKRTLIAEAYTAIKAAKTEPMPAAEVTLHYRPGTRRRFDADGLAVTQKVVLDALVRAGVLEDDSWHYVPVVSTYIHEPTPGVPAGMWLTLEEPLAPYLNEKD